MAQEISSLPSEQDYHMLCCYVNTTSQIQIARIANIPNWYFERAIFPGQRLFFEAPLDAELEIHASKMVSVVLADKIPCSRLCVSGSD